jgi:1-acyl-sn-glycerol-3-phosphate acyltransferase
MPPRWVRRIALPLYVIVLLALLLVAALVVLVGVLTWPLDRRLRMSRLAALAGSYCGVQLVSLTVAGCLFAGAMFHRPRDPVRLDRWLTRHQRLLAWALSRLLGAARAFCHFEVLNATTAEPAALGEMPPVLVLARHAGVGDSFVLVHLLLTHYRRRVRVVLKETLQVDPALDIILNRMGCCFLGAPSGADGADQVAELAGRLAPHDALLLFPEGGNWTPRRWRNAIGSLLRRHDVEAAHRASLMTHVLPARPGGVRACLAARPDLPVVVVAHGGLDTLVRPRQVWDRLPFSEPMTFRIWSTTPPPAPTEQEAWLVTEWAVVDEWVDLLHGGAPDLPPAR